MWTKLLAISALTLAFPRLAGAVDVTACEQIVPAGEVGRLVDHLNCPSGRGVTLEHRARLELSGFVLASSTAGGEGVLCEGRCSVSGPGRIDGFTTGVLAAGTGRVTVSDLALLGGFVLPRSDTAGVIATGGARVTLRDVSMLGHGSGVSAVRLRLDGVAIQQAESVGVNVVETVRGNDVIVTGGGTGIVGRRVRIKNLAASGNSAEGVRGTRSIRLIDSSVRQNDGLGVGVDLVSPRPPRLVRTGCGRSAHILTGIPFGVCTND